MGITKEYVDRAAQTESYGIPSPYADPAVVLAAPVVTRRSQEAFPALSPESLHSDSISSISPIGDPQYSVPPQSPISPMLAPLVSRRLSKRKQALQSRLPAGETPSRRIVSMPETRTDSYSVIFHDPGKRVVSMPNRIRPALEPSAELFSSPANESFGSYTGRRERVRVSCLPSDVPQTPSPPSSPDSLLIIDAGTQFPEGFLRRKCSQGPLNEEDEDWITWANSPPRPIPALHGPLSLPYARCPSGAEGTIIEEPENVAQMIWGLGPDDQPNNNARAEALQALVETCQKVPSHVASSVPPRLQKKKTSSVPQTAKVSRTPVSIHSIHTKPGNVTQSQRQTDNDRCSNPTNRVWADLESQRDVLSEVPRVAGQSMANTTNIYNNLMSDSAFFPVDNLVDDNHILEWQLARLRQAFKTSLASIESYDLHQLEGGLEPVVSPVSGHELSHSYPRIFVEPRPNELSSSMARSSPAEIAQQYRNQQLYRQALQKQKLQAQTVLPTPPNSSSPQWSSRFSPYLAYGSTFSPDVAGALENPTSTSQKYPSRSNFNTSHYLRHTHERHDPAHAGNSEIGSNFSSAQATQLIPNVNPSVSIRQSSCASSTLAKYIQQLQALSTNAHYSPIQPGPPPTVPLPPLPSAEEDFLIANANTYPQPVDHTPPSPESPPPRPRGVPRQSRTVPPTRLMQRRLSSVPEEDSIVLDLPSSVSPSRPQGPIANERHRVVSSSHERTTASHSHYLEVLHPEAGAPRKMSSPDFSELESNHETPSVKVRLPTTKESGSRGPTSTGRHETKGSQQGQKKKHRYKKLKGSDTSSGRAQPHEVAG